MSKRKRFRKNDGVSFLEDVKGLSEDVKMFFSNMPVKLKSWMYEATIIIDALQKLDDALQEGQPADKAIDFILAQIKGDADERIYEAIKFCLHDILEGINKELTGLMGIDKMQEASIALMQVSNLSELESDTVVQNAVYIYKS